MSKRRSELRPVRAIVITTNFKPHDEPSELRTCETTDRERFPAGGIVAFPCKKGRFR